MNPENFQTLLCFIYSYIKKSIKEINDSIKISLLVLFEPSILDSIDVWINNSLLINKLWDQCKIDKEKLESISDRHFSDNYFIILLNIIQPLREKVPDIVYKDKNDYGFGEQQEFITLKLENGVVKVETGSTSYQPAKDKLFLRTDNPIKEFFNSNYPKEFKQHFPKFK